MKYLIFIAALFFLNACSSTLNKKPASGIERFHAAMAAYDDEDYYESSLELQRIVWSFSGSTIADSAQFYLGQSHFKMEEYILAASEFEKLITHMPHSKLVPQAEYMLAESYFKQSPRPELDPEYTLKAIRAYQNFIEDFPNAGLRKDAEKKIAILRSKLAQKDYNSGVIYRKMKKFRASIIYFNDVLAEYYDTPWADDAQLGKVITYIDAEDYNAARKELDKFEQQFPDSGLQTEAAALGKEIEGHLGKQAAK